MSKKLKRIRLEEFSYNLEGILARALQEQETLLVENETGEGFLVQPLGALRGGEG